MEPSEIKSNNELDKQELYTYMDRRGFSNEIKLKIKEMFGVVLSGANDIKIDIDDFKSILDHGNKALCGFSEYEGANAVAKAIQLSIQDSSLDYTLLHKASGILIHFIIHPDLDIVNIIDAMEAIHESAYEEADVIWGTTTHKTEKQNFVKVQILFTGLA
jgi:cell division protein FtsZ